MGKVTAVAKLYGKDPQADGETTQLNFNADYQDERNKAWSRFTPALSLNMNVLNRVASDFETGENYLLTFEKQES